MNDSQIEFDKVSYIIKKAEWPTPSHSLAYRIQQATLDTSLIQMQHPTAFWGIGSPVLSFLAVMIALFLGISSGLATSNDAKASSAYTNYYHGTLDTSFSGLYHGKNAE